MCDAPPTSQVLETTLSVVTPPTWQIRARTGRQIRCRNLSPPPFPPPSLSLEASGHLPDMEVSRGHWLGSLRSFASLSLVALPLTPPLPSPLILPPPLSNSTQPLRAVQLCVASVEWTNQLPPLPLDSIWSSPPAPSAPPATGCSTTRSSWPTGARVRPTTRPSALTATSGLWPISPSLRNRLAQL